MNNQDTLREAWRTVMPWNATVDRKIMAALWAAGPWGLTCSEIEQRTGLKHQTASANLRHLVKRGLVVDSGLRCKLDNGRSAIVWVAVGIDRRAGA